MESNFWIKQAETLISSVGADFLRAATMNDIVARAGESFASMSENTRSGVLATAHTLLVPGT